MDFSGKKGAGSQHDGPRIKTQTTLGNHRYGTAVFDDDVVHGLLEQLQIRLRFNRLADEGFVERAVGLRARGANSRTFRGIECAPVDAGIIGGGGHDAAERVDFLDQMPFADAADGRIAAHRADGFDVVCQQQGARTGARRRQGGFGAGVAATNHNHIKGMQGVHRPLFSPISA